MAKEILITGTDGFVGNYIRDYFMKEGYEVYGTVYNMREPLENEVIVDFRKEEEFQKIPDKEFEIIINVAGVIDSNLPKELMMNINAEGTRRMTEWAKSHNCEHFIQISSVSAYGMQLLGEDRKEKKRLRNKGVFGINYSKSKAKAERYIEKSGLSGYTLLRFPPILGENDSYITPTIVPRLIEGNFYFSGNKERKYSTMNIKNIGPLLSKVINAGPQNEPFNCCDFEMTWPEYVAEYADQLNLELPDKKISVFKGLKKWRDKQYLLMVGYSYFGAHYCTDKLKEKIGFEPPHSWQEGVADGIKGYFREEPEMEKKWREKTNGK